MRTLALKGFNIKLKLAMGLVLFTLVSVFIVRFSGSASAQTSFMTVKSFTADYQLSNADPQGLLKTSEKIDVDFLVDRRGILRAIPEKYGDQDTNPKIVSVMRDGKNEPYITYSEGDNLVARIGEESTYITGLHTYEIVYEVENVIKFYDSHDELYWDVNGDQWQENFENVTANLSTDAHLTEPAPVCYTGIFGTDEQSCTIVGDVQSVNVSSSRELLPNETLTFITAFDKGYFSPVTWWEKYQNIIYVIPVFLFQLFVIKKAKNKWQVYGKDYKKRGVTAPYFERPKNVSVMEASYITSNALSPKHISANLIDLAIRGYIKITEKKEGSKTKHDLSITKTLDSSLSQDEILLLTELFSDTSLGASVRLEDKKNKLFSVVEKLKVLIDKQTLDKGYYELSPKNSFKKIALQIVLGVLAMTVGFIFAAYSMGTTAILGVISFVAVLIYAGLMTKRSPSGNLLVEHMDGLKLYLGFSEKDRINAQDAVSAPLAPSSGEPVRDVKFFEKLLPFAVAMGVEKTWAKAFENIYTQPPEWYSGNWNTFSAVALASSLNSTTTATSSAFSSPSSSGSSGFSGGGGFSGSGGGGGGGGSW